MVAMSDKQPFPDITFKVFSDFVIQDFSSWISLATILLVLFSLTENPDLLNLHGHQKNPQVQGERNETSSGWIKTLARALEDRLGNDARTLLKHKEIPQDLGDNALIIPIAIKLDGMAGILKLEPVFTKSGKVKHRLTTISHRKIAAVHVIHPASIECEDINCQPLALHQNTRLQDIHKVTLIKGTTVHKQVYVLTGKCGNCDANYHADHEGLNQTSVRRNRLYLNSAKYMKIGQNMWVD